MASNSTDTRNSTLMPSTAAKATFLVIFLTIGLFGNIVLIVTIGGIRRHRSTVIHIVTINFALTNLVNCLLNLSFAFGYDISSPESIDTYLCRINAFFMDLVTIETPLTLTVLSVDRFFYSVYPSKYVNFQNIQRTYFILLYTWIHSLAFSIPLVAGLISVEIYPNLSVCLASSVDTNTPYIIFYTLLCFILPICAITILFIFIIKSSFREKDHLHSMMTKQQYSKDSNSDHLQYLNEVNATKFVGALSLSWLLCEMPFNSAFIVKLTFSNVAYNPYAAVTLLWLKFSYVMALPFLAFTIDKDIWHSLKDRIFCRKNNSVVDAENKDYLSNYTKELPTEKIKTKIKQNDERKVVKEENPKETFIRTSGFQVPVLFATSNGVHIHTLNDDESLSETDDLYDHPKVKKCDVKGSQDFLNQYDTSDYDSSNEMDPFSVSHPVTSKSLKDSDETLQRRSNSHPDVHKKQVDTKRTSETILSATDSGLDISATRTTVLSSTLNTSKNCLITNEELQEKHEVPFSQNVIQEKYVNIPGEISELNTTQQHNLQTQHNGDTVHCTNCVNSDLDTSQTSIIDVQKIKRKKKRKDKHVNNKNLSDLSETSCYLDMKPPIRLRPLPKSPMHHQNGDKILNNKLSLDLLSAQQLCDTSISVVSPSACHLVSDDLVNCVKTSE